MMVAPELATTMALPKTVEQVASPTGHGLRECVSYRRATCGNLGSATVVMRFDRGAGDDPAQMQTWRLLVKGLRQIGEPILMDVVCEDMLTSIRMTLGIGVYSRRDWLTLFEGEINT